MPPFSTFIKLGPPFFLFLEVFALFGTPSLSFCVYRFLVIFPHKLNKIRNYAAMH